MKRATSEAPLKVKVERVIFNLLEANSVGVPPICGHDLLGEPPEKCVLVWANNVGPYEDMPPSTGVKQLSLTIRIEVPESERETLLERASSAVQTVLGDVPAVRDVVNLNGRSPDPRPVKLLHIYDIELASNPDMRSEEYSVEELVFNVVCGEHDG